MKCPICNANSELRVYRQLAYAGLLEAEVKYVEKKTAKYYTCDGNGHHILTTPTSTYVWDMVNHTTQWKRLKTRLITKEVVVFT